MDSSEMPLLGYFGGDVYVVESMHATPVDG